MKRSHVEQRMESRASPSSVERGLRLLRDRPALAAFIGRLAQASPAIAGAERMALALGPGDDVAHAVVARDGSGVTCLAPGMAFIGPAVPWLAVEAFLKQQDEALAARRALHAVKDADDDVSPLIRSIHHPHRLVRREWDVLRALGPLLGLEVVVGSVHVALESLQLAARGTTTAAWEELWRGYVGGAVALTLLGDQRGAEPALLAAVASCDLILSARALWYFGNQPEETLAFAERSVEVFTEPVARFALSAALAAAGFRAPGFFKEAERLRRRIAPEDTFVDDDVARREVKNLTVTLAPLLLQPFCVNAEALLSDRGTLDRVRAVPAQAIGDDVAGLAAAAGSWHTDALAIWRPFADEQRAPRLSPRAPGRATDVDDAALTMWKSVLRHHLESPLRHPWLARLITLAPVEALLPGEAPDPAWRLSDGVAYLKDTLPIILGAGAATTTTKPTQATPKTPPNAPCPCGSGKKWKKCHGKG